MNVIKIVARTGVTKGKVLLTSTSEEIEMPPGNKSYLFVDQILSTNKVDHGVSGSTLITEDHIPMGLVFAKGGPGLCYSNELTNLRTELKRYYDIKKSWRRGRKRTLQNYLKD